MEAPKIDPTEARAETSIADKYFHYERKEFCVLLEDIDIQWFWEEKELLEFDRLWTEGVSLWDIAERIGAEYHEAMLMMIDRRFKKKITKRKGGMNGTISKGITGI